VPSVKLSQETFDKLCALAARQGRTPDELVQNSIDQYVGSSARTPEQRKREWDELMSRFNAISQPNVTEDEAFAEIDAARQEARAERLARGH
jgi:predicted transcriptional regulator